MDDMNSYAVSTRRTPAKTSEMSKKKKATGDKKATKKTTAPKKTSPKNKVQDEDINEEDLEMMAKTMQKEEKTEEKKAKKTSKKSSSETKEKKPKKAAKKKTSDDDEAPKKKTAKRTAGTRGRAKGTKNAKPIVRLNRLFSKKFYDGGALIDGKKTAIKSLASGFKRMTLVGGAESGVTRVQTKAYAIMEAFIMTMIHAIVQASLIVHFKNHQRKPIDKYQSKEYQATKGRMMEIKKRLSKKYGISGENADGYMTPIIDASGAPSEIFGPKESTLLKILKASKWMKATLKRQYDKEEKRTVMVEKEFKQGAKDLLIQRLQDLPDTPANQKKGKQALVGFLLSEVKRDAEWDKAVEEMRKVKKDLKNQVQYTLSKKTVTADDVGDAMNFVLGIPDMFAISEIALKMKAGAKNPTINDIMTIKECTKILPKLSELKKKPKNKGDRVHTNAFYAKRYIKQLSASIKNFNMKFDGQGIEPTRDPLVNLGAKCFFLKKSVIRVMIMHSTAELIGMINTDQTPKFEYENDKFPSQMWEDWQASVKLFRNKYAPIYLREFEQTKRKLILPRFSKAAKQVIQYQIETMLMHIIEETAAVSMKTKTSKKTGDAVVQHQAFSWKKLLAAMKTEIKYPWTAVGMDLRINELVAEGRIGGSVLQEGSKGKSARSTAKTVRAVTSQEPSTRKNVRAPKLTDKGALSISKRDLIVEENRAYAPVQKDKVKIADSSAGKLLKNQPKKSTKKPKVASKTRKTDLELREAEQGNRDAANPVRDKEIKKLVKDSLTTNIKRKPVLTREQKDKRNERAREKRLEAKESGEEPRKRSKSPKGKRSKSPKGKRSKSPKGKRSNSPSRKSKKSSEESPKKRKTTSPKTKAKKQKKSEK
jgi:hypothetical protein